MVIRTIKLTSLFVNTENYRFEPLSSQKEAIDKMIEDQGDKLYSLVDDIVTNGLSPVDLIIVTPNEDSNKYVVLEGNRRITSLKLLNNPTLIDDKYSPLRKKFQKLQKEKPNAISELKNIACAVFETPTEADIWIKRKHSGELNGIGTVTWNAQQKQRFEEKTEGKSSIPLQIITLLKSQEEVSDTIKDSLSKLNITNLQRLMSDPYVREHLGLEINNGILVSKVKVSEVIKGLLKVVTDILNPEFKVSDIYNREKRKQYIDNFEKSQKPDLSNEASEQWSVQDIENNKEQASRNSEKQEIKGDKNDLRKINNADNILILPGNKSPERLLASYLYNLSDVDPLWSKIADGYTKQFCFREYSMEQINAGGELGRQNAKKWFNSQLEYWGRNGCKVLNPFLSSISEEAQEFRTNFDNMIKQYIHD